MIKIIWQRLPFLLGLVLCLLAVAVADETTTGVESSSTSTIKSKSAQTSTTLQQTHDSTAVKANDRHAVSGHYPPMKDVPRERHHRNIERFRNVMQSELDKLPALNRRMERLGEIQKRRYALQQERQAAAAQTSASRDVIVKRFHTLLREDQELSDKARQVAADIVKDMPRIKRQLNERKNQLLAELEDADATTGSVRMSDEDLHRRLRYINYLDDKLNDVRQHPERLDLLSRMLKGLPPSSEMRWNWGQHDNDDDTTRTLKSKRPDNRKKPKAKNDNKQQDAAEIAQLKRERRILMHRVHQIDTELKHLDARPDPKVSK